MTIMLVGRLLAAFLTGSFELTSWFTADTGTHFQYFRAVGLVLSDGNPVIVGCIEDRMPFDYNRLFTAREYDLDDPDDALWRCDYEDEAYGSLDDDGYAIVRYETEGDPPVEHFIAAGDTRVDLHFQLVPNDEYSAGLALCLDSDGDTECPPLVFRGTWYDAMSRGITYIGELGEDSDAYAACGLYDTLDGSSFSFRGFVEIASGNTEIDLIEDSEIVGTWEEILFDPDEEILVVGGLCNDPERAGMNNLRLGCVILSGEAPYEIDDQGEWYREGCQFLEGPLLKLDSGFYAYMGNVSTDTTTGIALTLWTWDSGESTITCEAGMAFDESIEEELGDYSQISVFAAAYRQDLVDSRLILLMGAQDGDGHPCILIAHQVVFPGSMTFGGFGIDEVLPVVPESGYTVEAGGFVFTDRDPVQGVGAGHALGASDQKIWLFEIAEE